MREYDAKAVADLEQQYASPQVIAQRKAFRAVLAAQAGETGLDVGCGPGYLACELAAEVAPAGRIVAIDKSEASLTAARARISREGVAGTVELRAGDASRLDFPDGTFDFVTATQVYCFVSDVVGALREAARVLRDGGRVAVLDTDWDLCTWDAPDPALTRRVLAARDGRYAHAHLPRELPGLFRDAGLKPSGAHVFPMIETRYDPGSFGAECAARVAEEAAHQGIAGAAAWEAGLRERGAAGNWFFCVNRFIFTAVKPADGGRA